jgi:uncharacterized protein YdaU (DUF1376 family)
MWQTPGCRIPNDDAWIAHKLKRPVDDVSRDFRPIIKEFCESDGNYLYQKRLRKEFAYVKKKSKQRSVASKARWGKDKNDTVDHAKPMREDSGSHHSRNAHHFTSPTLKDSPPVSPKGANGKAHDEELEKQFEAFFAVYPKRSPSNPRQPAFKSYVRARRTGATHEAIMQGVGAYAALMKATAKERTEFVAQAATWLNQQRWKDDYAIGNATVDKQAEARRRLEQHRASTASERDKGKF